MKYEAEEEATRNIYEVKQQLRKEKKKRQIAAVIVQ